MPSTLSPRHLLKLPPCGLALALVPTFVVGVGCQPPVTTSPDPLGVRSPGLPVGPGGDDLVVRERDGEGPEPDVAPEPDVPVELCDPVAAPAPARLLTRAEIDRTLRDLLGETQPLTETLPPENVALGFENNAEAHIASPALVEALADVMELAADRAVTQRLATVAPCAPAAVASAETVDDATCGATFIDTFGPRAFRRPLTSEERQTFVDVLQDGMEAGGLVEGLSSIIQVALLSPQFLYRTVAVGEGEQAGAPVPLDGWEVASRLSYLLWGTMPDQALFDAAQSGALLTEDGVATQVDRMLGDVRARDALDDFHRQWLELDHLRHLEKDGAAEYNLSSDELAEEYIASMKAFLAHAMLGHGDALEGLFTSQTLFVDEGLADVLGVQAGPGLTPVVFPAEERAGLLTQPGLLALLSHPSQTSPIKRGIFVRESLLCETLPDPPADLLIEPPSPDPNATTRERFAEHTENETCQNCHILIDPIGFGFEQYDEMGRFRTEENGLPVDASGSLLYTWSGQPDVEGDFVGAVELAERLARSEQVGQCLVRQWYRYAMGRGEGAPEDQCALDHARHTFETSGHNLQEMLTGLVTAPSFRTRPGAVWTEPLPLPEPGDELDPGPDPEPDVVDPACVGDEVGAQPIGHFDSISADGIARGWALDPNSPCYEVTVEVFLDGPPGQGTYLYPVQRADLPRPDVNNVTGYAGDHGFAFLLPAQARDGQAHQIWLVAGDTGSDGNAVVPNSPLLVAATGNAVPTGYVDVVTADGHVSGWAYDPDNPQADLTVRVYLDAPSWQGGAQVAVGQTGNPRPDVDNAFGLVNANAGFSIQLGPAALDGQPHVLYVSVVDAADANQLGHFPYDGFAFQVTP